ncbi:MAG: DNA-processing protein DprA [Chloroflexota bacterium]
MAEHGEAAAWLALLCDGPLGRGVAKDVIHRWAVRDSQPLAELWACPAPALVERLGLDAEQAGALLAAWAAVEAHRLRLVELAEAGIGLVTRADVAYPELLAERLGERDLPYFFYHAGSLAVLTQPGVALLGSAHPSDEAARVAGELAARLAAGEHLVVGGYDRGVDRLALDAARGAGGQAALVLPLGMGAFRPTLAHMSAELEAGRTLVLSPYPPEAPPTPRLAEARLSLVAGLCTALVLIAPEQGPEAWPWLERWRGWGGTVHLWTGVEDEVSRRWSEAGAQPFQRAEQVCRALAADLGAEGAESAEAASPPDVTPIACDPAAPEVSSSEALAPFATAQEALDALARGGHVPPGLARRLRERPPPYGHE